MSISKFHDWKDEYSVGVASVDSQHQKLFLMVKTLDQYIEKGETHLVMKNFLLELIKYTMVHFEDEEGYMASSKMPRSLLAQHIAEHHNLVEQVKEFVGEFEKEREIFTPKLIQFLMDWLKNHIVRTDKKISQFI